jgi:hypothetical protein
LLSATHEVKSGSLNLRSARVNAREEKYCDRPNDGNCVIDSARVPDQYQQHNSVIAD